VAHGSALRVLVNGSLVNQIDLPPGTADVTRQRTVLVPVADIRPFGNTIVFNFDFVPANRDSASSPVLSGEILRNTSLDLNGLALWTRMPDLNLFAQAGFPFTKFADLSQTVVVLPAVPSAQEIALFLHLMSYFGAQTGYPALRVTVSAPNAAMSPDSDYLILGTGADQPAFQTLAPILPATLDNGAVHTQHARSDLAQGVLMWRSLLQRARRLLGQAPGANMAPTDSVPADAIIEGAESSASHGRSIIAIMLKQDSTGNEFTETFLDPSRSSGITDSLSLLQNSTFTSYESNAATYHAGNLSWYAQMRVTLTQYFLILLVAVLSLSFLCAYYVYGWMARRAHQRLQYRGSDERLVLEGKIS
jgi:cellulose synthase (UDP-forming)